MVRWASFAGWILNLNPALSNTKIVGKNPRAVMAVESLMRDAEDVQFLHLNTTLDAHQKLATLSSNKPRAKGKIRVTGPRIVVAGEKGGRKGRKRKRNVASVTDARRIKNLVLWN